MKMDSLIVGIFIGAFFTSSSLFAGEPTNSGEPGQNSEKKEVAVQVTFITPLGTNGRMATDYTNKFSFNILSGINGGLNGVEMGYLTNSLTGSMRGVQFAGIGNYVHQEVDGVQMSGIFNIGRNYVKGGQFAGCVNLSLDGFKGAQISGITNVNIGDVEGFQGAGLVNVATGDVSAFQVSGLINYAGVDASGGQAAGLVNIALRNSNSMQIGGLINYTGQSHSGLQAAGLINIAQKEVKGAQTSGILNYTKKLNGLQLGFINIADSVESGAMIGLFNYARNGYMSLQVSSDESFHGHLSFRMGLRKIYTVYNLGFAALERPTWGYGFGLGSYLIDAEKFGLLLEGSSYQINEDRWWTDQLNMLVRLNLNFQYNLNSKMALLAGLSGNVAISNLKDEEGVLTGGTLTPDWTFYEHSGKTTKTTIYPGFNFGFKYTIK